MPNRSLICRGRDVSVSLFLLVLLFPVFLVALVSQILVAGRPVFFVQVRPGRGGEPFRIFKIRTMCSGEQQEFSNLRDKFRGLLWRFFRASSIDELPQLWNVLKGDMSLVGPRPLLMDYLPAMAQFGQKRLQVRPGMTGLAQVSGRNQLSWEAKIRLDEFYVENHSCSLDARIMVATFKTVLGGSGVDGGDWLGPPELSPRREPVK